MMKSIGRRILKKIAKECPGAGLRISLFKLIGVNIGKDVYIAEGLTIAEDLYSPENIIIGDRVAIGPEVILITSSHPNNSILRESKGTKSGGITIESDAWIGAGAIIFPGIRIGRMAIIGAGAVIRKDVQEGATMVGNPAIEVKVK